MTELDQQQRDRVDRLMYELNQAYWGTIREIVAIGGIEHARLRTGLSAETLVAVADLSPADLPRLADPDTCQMRPSMGEKSMRKMVQGDRSEGLRAVLAALQGA